MSIDRALDHALDQQAAQDDARSLPPRPANGHPSSGPCEHDRLTVAARKLGKRGQAAAARADKALATLRAMLAADGIKRREAADKAAREAQLCDRIARLERETREARALLRGKPSLSEATAKEPTIDARAARVWAAANGVECNPHGRVPASVITAYQEAHPDGA